MDDRYRSLKGSLPPPWDELREARVGRRVQEALSEPARRPRVGRRPWLLGGLAVSAVAAALLLVLRQPFVVEQRSQAGVQASPARVGLVEASGREGSSHRQEEGSSLSFVDGSVAHLAAGAEVETKAQSEQGTRLLQRRGTVEYTVVPQSGSRFVVEAAAVIVEVVGTRFTVALQGEAVEVRVSEGVVRVKSASGQVELRAGEELKVRSSPEAELPPTGMAKAEAVRAKAPAQAPAAPEVGTAEELLRRADEARRAGKVEEAAQALRQVLERFSGDRRATTARFTLARLEETRGRYAEAASLFAEVRQSAPGGALAEDALAGQARALGSAGNLPQASRVARQYLKQYPFGPHANRMQQLVE